MSNELVTLHTTTWCPFCQKLAAALDSAGIPYTNIDVEDNPDAGEWVKSVNNGNRVVPTVLYSDGSHATNPPAKQVIRRYEELSSSRNK